MICVFEIPRIFLEQKLIYHGYFWNICIFCGVNVTLYDAFNMIHDVITTVNPFPYTAKFMFVGKIIKLYKSDVER